MRRLNSDNSAMKNIVSGVLLVGGLAAGIVGASIIAHANEAALLNSQGSVRNKSIDNNQNISEISVVETEEDLAKIVMENGNQVMVDEETGKMYLAYLNDNSKVEIVEITQDELNDLINQVSRISNVEQNNEEQGSYIPREYLRGDNGQEQKSQRKRLNSEEGRQAVERAKQHKKSNK